MFKNYIKTATRFLKQNKVFAGINVFGLSIAFATSFIILLYVINELSYDNCHKNRKRVFRVLNYYVNFKKTMPYTPYILAPTLKEEFPQVDKAISVGKVNGFKLKLKGQYINVSDVTSTSSEVFNIFTLPLSEGTLSQNLLVDPNSIVLSSELAEKFFSGKNLIGREIIGTVNDEEHLFVVTGIFKNIPKNSSFKAQCFVNNKWGIEAANKYHEGGNSDKGWDLDAVTTWVQVSKDCNVSSLDQQFRTLEEKYTIGKKHYSLQNLSDVHFGSNDILYSENNGNLNTVKMFSLITFLILLVSTINYIILSTAVSTGRAKEIGIRKTSGAEERSIRNQLLFESILLAQFVLPIALIVMWVALPYAERVFQTDLNIISSNIIRYASLYLTLTILTGTASGIYTSHYLSRLKVIDIFKNSALFGKGKQLFRSSLIVLQLVIFCAFVSGTLIISSQYQYALRKDPGYNNKNILFVDLGNDFKGYSYLLNIIKSNPDIISASGTSQYLPVKAYSGFLVNHFQDKNVKVPVQAMFVNYNFLRTIGITLLEGRDFSQDFGTDFNQSAILNETAVKLLGIPDPVGKPIGHSTIIGIVKDFNIYSIRSKIPPVSIGLSDRYLSQLVINYKPGTLSNLLPFLKTELKKIIPDKPFEYSTIEEQIRNDYSSEKSLGTIVSISALFTLLIALSGIFGLTLFISKSRTKEIGIKKIFGSSNRLIILSFLRTSFILVLLASLLSIPVTLYFITKWLNNYAYKIHITLWAFIIPFAISAGAVLLTVFIHSYKVSCINPVKAIQHE